MLQFLREIHGSTAVFAVAQCGNTNPRKQSGSQINNDDSDLTWALRLHL